MVAYTFFKKKVGDFTVQKAFASKFEVLNSAGDTVFGPDIFGSCRAFAWDNTAHKSDVIRVTPFIQGNTDMLLNP